ncbi:hypothetical protein GGI42DRAFT_229774 [Trichoderma sp. SZMC 28013]
MSAGVRWRWRLGLSSGSQLNLGALALHNTRKCFDATGQGASAAEKEVWHNQSCAGPRVINSGMRYLPQHVKVAWALSKRYLDCRRRRLCFSSSFTPD